MSPIMTLPALAAALAAAPATAMAAPPPADQDRAAALALFKNDAVLNYWALKNYDADGDIVLSAEEAAAAADGLKAIADGDADGRVTTYEFDRAREYLVARF